MKIKRAVIIVSAILGALLALGLTINGLNGDLTSKRDEYPACELEDGSTQADCLWVGDNGVNYINHNYGEWWEVHPNER